MGLLRARLAGIYIFKEMLPSFILGNVVFIFILLMFQVLRLSDFIIIHGTPIFTIIELVSYMMISFLPACIPISLLFSILLTYGRLSSDSEIVALKACGLHLGHLLAPAVVLSFFVGALSWWVSFYGAPKGNREFELLFGKLASSKVVSQIQPGTFAEGFFDLVLYADEVDEKESSLKRVFIYDERDNELPLTVMAQEGRLIEYDPDMEGTGVMLSLRNGDIHRPSEKSYSRVDFQKYNITLFQKSDYKTSEKSPQSYDIHDMWPALTNGSLSKNEKKPFAIEFHKRAALVGACLLFGLLGVGAGTVANRRAVRSSGMIVCITIMVVYWILYVSGDSLAQSGRLPPWVAMWMANFIFLGVSVWTLKKAQ